MWSLIACLLAALATGAAIFTGSAGGGAVNAVFILSVIGFLGSLIYVIDRRMHPGRRNGSHGGGSVPGSS